MMLEHHFIYYYSRSACFHCFQNGAYRNQWKELLESVALDIIKFWTFDKETKGLINVVKKV